MRDLMYEPGFVVVQLAIDGMGCASCARWVERELGRLPGVSATVDHATGRTRVSRPDLVTTQTLVETVRVAEYGATPVLNLHDDRANSVPAVSEQ
jgi:cation transport ATPase